eukprot:3241440-Prymnesium_polylepis.2
MIAARKLPRERASHSTSAALSAADSKPCAFVAPVRRLMNAFDCSTRFSAESPFVRQTRPVKSRLALGPP